MSIKTVAVDHMLGYKKNLTRMKKKVKRQVFKRLPSIRISEKSKQKQKKCKQTVSIAKFEG
jgi:hypothetical protein